MKIRTDIRLLGCIYCILIAFCIANIYLNIIQIDNLLITRIAVCACGVYAVGVAATGLTSSKYSTFLQIITILLSARLLGLWGTILCGYLTSEELFRLPFSNIGSFIFNLIAMGFLRFISDGNEKSSRTGFSPLFLIPLSFFTVPYLIDWFFIDESVIFMIYSYLYTSVPAVLVLCCLISLKKNPAYIRIIVLLIIAALSDMIVYLHFTPIAVFLPEGINYLLFPLYSMLIADAALRLQKGAAV